MLLSVLALVRVLDQSMVLTLSVLEKKIVSLIVPTQRILLPVPMPMMLESIALIHVSLLLLSSLELAS